MCVFTQHDPQLIVRDAQKTPIHRAKDIELYVPALPLLRALAERVERAMSWELSLSGGQLYVTVGAESFEGALTRLPLE